MLEFNFRNGILRRKYDGLKYALRSIENIVYELSLLQPVAAAPQGLLDLDDGEVMCEKKARIESETASSAGMDNCLNESMATYYLLDASDIDNIRARMDAFDSLREDVIKQSRDVQKLSKQAIFAIHRGALADANSKLGKGRECIEGMLKAIEKVAAFCACNSYYY